MLIAICLFYLKIKPPAHSPELNPIEELWASVKRFIGKKRCTSLAELKYTLKEYCETKLTPIQCQKKLIT